MKNKIFLITIVLLLSLVVSVSADLNNLNICDDRGGTSLVRDRVTVCQGNIVFQTVESVETLARTNSRPLYLRDEGVTLLYFEPTEGDVKEVGVVLTLPVTPMLPALPLGSISSNLLDGQGIMLVVGVGNTAEFYLLNHSTEEALFSPDKLTLVHVPTGRKFLPNNFEGSNIYVFETIGDERISMQIRENEFKITSLQPGERPAAYVIPQNLAEKYELTFTQATPIREIGLGLGVLTVCQEDNPRDGQQIKICRAGEEFSNTGFTLQVNQLTKRDILGKNVIFLFEVLDGIKTVKLYNLKTLSEIHGTFNYDNFINNMVEGRRIALEFPANGNIYLLGHPVSPFISLPQLQLEFFSNGQRTTFPAVGSEGRIALPTVGGGVIFLERNYGNPPPPFEIWALTPQQITPVNLEQELNTYVSSLGTKQFDIPDFGLIQKRGDDIARSANMFKLQDKIGNFDLQLNIPQERRAANNYAALFYYDSASLDGGISVKTAEVYRLYFIPPEVDQPDNDVNAPEHIFNDAFISTLTSGGQIALKFADEYYILYHENELLENVFFNVDKLRLRTLNNSQTFIPSTVGSVAKFTVTGGQIRVTVDEIINKMLFAGTAQEDLVTSNLAAEDYTVVLDTTPNQVNVENTLLSMCNLGVYTDVGADVCYGQTHILIETSKVMKFGANTYLLEVNGQRGNAKEVTIRKILQVEGADNGIANWNTFVSHIQDNDVPIFNVSNGLYLPRVQNNALSTFQLQKYPAGTVNSLRNVRAITQVTSNGTFVLPEKVLFVEQTLEGFNAREQFVSAYFTAQNYGFLPENGDAIEFNSSVGGNVLRFATSLDGDVVEITRMRVDNRVVRLSIGDLINRWFAQGDVRIIVVNGVTVEITVDAIEERGVVLLVRRI